MGAKGWIIFIAICIITLGGLVVLSSNSKQKIAIDVASIDVNVAQKASEQNGQIADHTYGNKNAKTVIVEYGDFQCPGCAGVAPTVKELKEKYKEDVLLVFRNMVLPYHQNALAAASVAEAAGLQDKYWQMHDLLYSNQKLWENLNPSDRTRTFEGYAQQIGLDMDKFRTDLKSDAVSQKIAFDAALAKKRSVTSTPSLYINGDSLSSDVWGKKESFENAIKEAIK